MKIKILRATIANKRPVEPGDILEVPAAEAVDLIRLRKADPARDQTLSPVPDAEIAPLPSRDEDATLPAVQTAEKAVMPRASKRKKE